MRSTTPMDGLLRIRGSSQPDRVAMAAVSAAAREAGLGRERLDDLKTAVAELCLNALEHGNGNRRDLPMEVRFTSGRGLFSVSVRDHGRGFAPDDYPSPRLEDQIDGTGPTRGWGLFLVRQLADRLDVSSDERGCLVELSFECGAKGDVR